MKRITALALAAAFLGADCTADAQETLSPASVTIKVEPGARQKFQGFGVSLLPYPDGFPALSSERRRTMARLVWHDENIKILRLWFAPRLMSPTPGVIDDSLFVNGFIKDDALALAKANGVTTLLLAPDEYPAYMAEAKPRADGQTYIRDEQIPVWMTMLAQFIQRMRDTHHVSINATGIVNEPGQEKKYSVTQMALAVKDLRAELDVRGLGSVQIVAPESANTATGADELTGYIDAMEADPASFRALSGVATHDYNMGNTDAVEPTIARAGKPYWITEAGGDGAQDSAGDPIPAASAASRYLTDMNHLVTHWIWFLGGENVSESIDDPHSLAGGSRLIQYKTTPGAHWYRMTRAYYSLQQLSQTFDPGAVFRKSVSDQEGDMGWSYGHKPRLTAAAARNPDGSWGIGISNYTADDFPGFDQFHKDNSGFPAKTFAVTVTIPELARVKTFRFAIRRSNKNLDNVPDGFAVMHNGTLSVAAGPLDVVTLRSAPMKGKP